MSNITICEKKNYLLQYQTQSKKLNCKLEELERWRDTALKVTSTLNDMPSASTKSDKIQNAVDMITQLQHEIDKDSANLILLRKNILKSIETVNDETSAIILQYKYINMMSVEEIADIQHYSERWVQKLHNVALNKIKICVKPKSVRKSSQKFAKVR